jgi:hypothetical protein
MRFATAALALSLLSVPAFARGASAKAKGPKAGQFCSKSAVGTTATDAKGGSLECKAGKKGGAHWTKK